MSTPKTNIDFCKKKVKERKNTILFETNKSKVVQVYETHAIVNYLKCKSPLPSKILENVNLLRKKKAVAP